jgi:hypothetical protein
MAVALKTGGCSALLLGCEAPVCTQGERRRCKAAESSQDRVPPGAHRRHASHWFSGGLLAAGYRGRKNAARQVVARGDRSGGGRAGVAEKSSDQSDMPPEGPSPLGHLVKEVVEEPAVGLEILTKYFANLPDRYKTVLMTSGAFILCNMDKVRDTPLCVYSLE